jgi:hypothetical protein
MQNLHKGVRENLWSVDWSLFREYLNKVYDVTRAVVFMGFIKKNQSLYDHIENAGFVIEFREVNQLGNGKIDGGNVDADLASYVMDYKNDYRKAIIVADDGDYARTIQSLKRQNKLQLIISSHSIEKTSRLIKEIALEFILSINTIRHLIESKNI